LRGRTPSSSPTAVFLEVCQVLGITFPGVISHNPAPQSLGLFVADFLADGLKQITIFITLNTVFSERHQLNKNQAKGKFAATEI
jgi:hypothetical protein